MNSILEKPVASGFKRVQRVHRGRLTGLRPEGCGRLMAAGYIRFAQGATAPAALRVADCRRAAMLIKSALRIYLSAPYGMKSILLTGSLRSLPPIRLRRTSPAVRSVNRKEGPFMGRLRAYFDRLAHPMQDVHRGRIKLTHSEE